MTSTTRAWLQMHFCVLLWGFTAILGRTITLQALPLVWLRMVVVTVVVLLFPGFWKGLSRMSPRLMLIYAGIGALVTAHWITFYSAIKIANASVAATCMGLTPGIRRPCRAVHSRNVDLMCGSYSLVLRSFPVWLWSLEAHRRECAPASQSASCPRSFAALVLHTEQDSSFRMRDAITVTGLEMVVGAVGLAFVSPHVWPSRHDAVLILVLAIGCTLVPYVLSLVALRHMSAFSAVAGREYGAGVRDRAGNPAVWENSEN